MRKNQIIAGIMAAAVFTTTGIVAVNARSSMRAAWNDASSQQYTATAVKDACFVENGSETAEHDVYSNVYANSGAWTSWKTLWQNEISSDYEKASLTPGKNETQINLAWYTTTKEKPVVRLLDTDGQLIKSFSGKVDVNNAETIVENGEVIVLYPNKVTVTGLKENTSYKYQYSVDGKMSDVYDYSTESFSSFSVMYVGDPQIGASKGQVTANGKTSAENGVEYYAMNDAYNWNQTLKSAVSANSHIAFILSAGDQINQTDVSNDANKLEQQKEYAGFLYPEVLRSVPIATTIGNHDSKSVNYSNHFNNPNVVTADSETDGRTTAGTDYFFRYGNTLFISIDTNNYNCATHENVIKKATEANKDAKWRVLMFHQDIYGSGYDHSDSDGMILRTQLTPIIDKYDIDVVLQGHDHTYSRTYQISADGTKQAYDKSSEDAQYFADNASCYSLESSSEQGTKIVNPEGTVYFEANSSTGSKYYQMIGTQQDYIAARSQSWRPTYSIIDISDDTFTVKTYDAATNNEIVADGGIKTEYTIIKGSVKTPSITESKSSETGKLSVKSKAIKNASGYEFMVSADSSFKSSKTITASDNSCEFTGLKKNKTYYVKVRAYRIAEGEKIFSEWSSSKKCKTSK